MNVVLMGPPGAGKGTQAEIIRQHYSIPVIATGDMFREAVSQKTELGTKAKHYMDQGQLVPDEVTIGIVKERLAQPDCQDGFMLDGFPRTTPQAEALDQVLADTGRKIEAAINISVTEEVLIERIEGRVSCPDCKTIYHLNFNPASAEGICDECGASLTYRSDDRGDVAKKRLEVYLEQTLPLLEYYKEQGLLFNIDGNRPADEVFRDIKGILENL